MLQQISIDRPMSAIPFTTGVTLRYLEQGDQEVGKVLAHVWRQVSASFVEQSTTIGLPRIRAPALMLWGDQDQFASRSD